MSCSFLVHSFLAAEIQFSVFYRHLGTFEFSLHFSFFSSILFFRRIQLRTVKLLLIANRRTLTVFKVDYLILEHKCFSNISFAEKQLETYCSIRHICLVDQYLISSAVLVFHVPDQIYVCNDIQKDININVQSAYIPYTYKVRDFSFF